MELYIYFFLDFCTQIKCFPIMVTIVCNSQKLINLWICGQLLPSLVVIQSLSYVQLFGSSGLQYSSFPSQEAGKMVWQCHLFKSFPQLAVIHTVQGLSTVNEAEVDFFWKFSCFFYDPMDASKLMFCSSNFSKSSWFMCCQYFSFTLVEFSLTG